MGIDDIGDVEVGEGRTEGLAGFGIGRGWSRGTVATTEVIGTNDEEAVGVDGLARPDHVGPPAFVKFFSPELAVGRGIRMSS